MTGRGHEGSSCWAGSGWGAGYMSMVIAKKTQQAIYLWVEHISVFMSIKFLPNMDQKGSATNHFNQSPPGYIRHD